jgi:serine/threonine-protein kinase
MYWVSSDGGGAPLRLTDGRKDETPHSISPDGKRLAFSALGENGAPDIYTAPFDGNRSHPALGKPELFVGAPFIESQPAFSPDGRWLAYDADETGHLEVYVRPYPGPGGRWQISTGGGSNPRWSRDGRELLYLGPDRRIMAAGYTAKGETFVPGKPRLRLDFQVLPGGGSLGWDLAPNGKRFVVLTGQRDEDQKPQTHLTFLFHFADELERRAGAAK